MPFDVYNMEKHEMKTVYHEKELVEAIQNTISYYRERLESAAKTKDELREEIRQEYNNEIEQLKRKLKFSYYRFGSEEEQNEYNKFCEEHRNCRSTAINKGRIPYIIPTYTGIGINSVVVCPVCKELKDITDYSIW